MSADIEALLDAGLVAPVGTPPAGVGVGVGSGNRSRLSARAYEHPGLADDRRVVRLAPESLASAEDTAMDNLGFAAPAYTELVGVVRPRALRFPEWTLVHDPDHFRAAVRLSKELLGLSKLAAKEVGKARTEIERMADQLAAASPLSLPTFYEQAGRVLLDVGRRNAASAMFAQARAAERTHTVPFEDEAQYGIYLEFARAGALSVQMLGDYLRELERRCAAEVGYARYRRLSVERVVHGQVPHAALPDALRRLGARAGITGVEEDVRLCTDLLASPSMVKARAGFWKALAPVLARAAQAEPRVHGLLLDFMPAVPATPNVIGDELWLEILEGCGTLDCLVEGVEDLTVGTPGTQPADGAAGWLGRFGRNMLRDYYYYYLQREGKERHQACPPRLIELLRRMAPRLRAEGVPVRLEDRYMGVHVDLLARCLAEQIPLEDPSRRFGLREDQLQAWGVPGQADLSSLAADPRYGPHLKKTVRKLVENPQNWRFKSKSTGAWTQWLRVPGIASITAAWVDEQAELMLACRLMDLERSMRVWQRLYDFSMIKAVVATNPQAWARIMQFDIAGLLAESLRLGIPDEFGWAALEEACEDLDPLRGKKPDDRANLTTVDQWPYLIVSDGAKVAVVAHDKVVYREDLSTRPGYETRRKWLLRWTEGSLEIEDGVGGRPGVLPGSIELPDGSRSFGDVPFHAGDAECEWYGPVATDGERFWTLERTEKARGRYWRTAKDREWQEFEPETGERGETGRPEFFGRSFTDPSLAEQFAGAALVDGACSLLTMPDGAGPSPLGQYGRLVGWRTVRSEDGTQAGIGVDGREVSSVLAVEGYHRDDSPAIVGAIRFPGATADLPVVWHFTDNLTKSFKLTVLAPDGGAHAYIELGDVGVGHAAGSACVVPWQFWHFLIPRDPAGSAFLRGYDQESAYELLLASINEDQQGILEHVERLMPAVTDPRLRAGIRGYVSNTLYSLIKLIKFDRAVEAEESDRDPQDSDDERRDDEH